MSASHTPGPWRLGLPNMVIGHIVAAGNDTMVADCNSSGGINPWASDEQKANARLISAAPDLLDALQELIRIRDWAVIAGADKAPLPQDLIRKFAEMQIPAVDTARAAIAKATDAVTAQSNVTER